VGKVILSSIELHIEFYGAEPFLRSWYSLSWSRNFYGNRRFITVSISRNLSWARSIQSTPSQNKTLRYVLTLPDHLRLGLPSDFHTKILYASLNLLMRASWPAQLLLLDLIALTIIVLRETYWFRNGWEFLHQLSHKHLPRKSSAPWNWLQQGWSTIIPTLNK